MDLLIVSGGGFMREPGTGTSLFSINGGLLAPDCNP